MCGIAGFFDPLARTKSSAHSSLGEVASHMVGRLRHRGPDGDGIWTDSDAGLALGHRRLAVVDLSELGAQPMVSANGRYVITYNGEVYNFQEIRSELEERNHQFNGSSDTEVILAAISEWGLEETVTRLLGMFAFALWDKTRQRLSLVRDRLGVKPLCWAWTGDVLLFASEVTALEAHPLFCRDIDREAVAALVRNSYIPSPATIYKKAKKLPPGSILHVETGTQPDVRTYWNLRERIGDARGADCRSSLPSALSDIEAIDHLESLLADSVRRRMIADVPLGAFLSGGIDSSTVVALMQHQSTRRIRTFTIGFHDPAFNEAEHAKAIAAHLGTDHTELYLGPSEILDIVPEIPSLFDEPFGDSSQIPTYLVSAMTRRHVTVALSGDGGDELFAGYPKYGQIEQLWRRIGWIPSGARHALGRGIRALSPETWEKIGALLPRRLRPPRLGSRAHGLSQILGQASGDSLFVHLDAISRDSRTLVPGALGTLTPTPEAGLASTLPDLVSRMQYYDMLGYLPDDILVKVDRCSMAVSLEAREPLLDHRLAEFVWSLPSEMKIRNGRSKYLLRAVLAKHVPKTLTDRPKMGFSVPLAEWLQGPLRAWAEDLLTPQALEAQGLFDSSAVRAIWKHHNDAEGREASSALPTSVIWNILMMQGWLRDRKLA